MFSAVNTRGFFPTARGGVAPSRLSTLRSLQKFRWVHFPFNANLPGDFTYRVTPVFMSNTDVRSLGDAQEAKIELRRETFPGQLNIAYTRGFVASQAFVERYKTVAKLLPAKAKDGLSFVPTHPQTIQALAWMAFEAREAILDVLNKAVPHPPAHVRSFPPALTQPHVV